MKVLKSMVLLVALAQSVFSSVGFFLVSGNDFEGEIAKITRFNVEIITGDGVDKKLLFAQIAAMKVNGEIQNGPFDLNRLRILFPGFFDQEKRNPEPLSIAGPDSGLNARDAAQDSYRDRSRTRLRYGIQSSFMMVPGPGGTTSGSSFIKVFSRCSSNGGSERCSEENWIGLAGEDLASAVDAVPEARSEADKIKLTTGIQALSLIATPIFLFSFIELANGPRDESGRATTHIGPAAMTCLVLTGASFANYIGWNIYEGIVARRSIDIYNDKIDMAVNLEKDRAGVHLAHRF